MSNTATMAVYANVWATNQAYLNTFWSTDIPAGSGVTAHRFVIPPNVNGPYPHGTRLMVAAATVNWFGNGQAIGNQSTTAVSLDRSLTVTVGGGHSTQFVLDVVGYLV